jgi:hypothetical protein
LFLNLKPHPFQKAMGNCNQTPVTGASRNIPGVYEPPSSQVVDELYTSGRCHIYKGVATSTSATSKVTKTDKIMAVNPAVRILGNRLVIKRSRSNEQMWVVGFEYEATAECQVTIHFGAQEIKSDQSVTAPVIKAKAPPLSVSCEDGQFMEFSQETYSTEHNFDPALYSLVAQATYYPIVVELATNTPSGTQKHMYYGSLADFRPKLAGSEHKVMIVKQGIEISGTFHILQEIYGLSSTTADGDDSGKKLEAENECIVCLTEQKDTSLMPCRHLCVCQGCGGDLVKRKMKCPICRQQVVSLLILAQ